MAFSGNQADRVNQPGDLVTGPLPGENLLQSFRDEMKKETLLQMMFGDQCEHVFVNKWPNMNETILPAILLSWKNENFMSNDTYLDGAVEALIALPVKLTGDFNALRRVASMLQRWMSGAMSLFDDRNPGLTAFGHGMEFNYDGLAKFDGFSAPAIQVSIPFRFDLQLMRLQRPYDPNAPLDQSDIGWIESMSLGINDSETGNILIQQEVLSVTGQTN